MSDASTYPVTTPYGQVAGYPLNNGFHNGVDYGCPVGTPVIVNGVTIGLSGSTGYSTGPHLHVGRWVNGTVTNPGVGGGFHFNSAVVTQISSDTTNGNYVRVQGDGASWVYLHLSNNNLVSVGQVLQGGDEMVNNSGVNEAFIGNLWRPATADEVSRYSGKITTEALNHELLNCQERKDLVAQCVADEDAVRMLAVSILRRSEPLVTTPDLKSHIGKRSTSLIKEFWNSPEGRKHHN